MTKKQVIGLCIIIVAVICLLAATVVYLITTLKNKTDYYYLDYAQFENIKNRQTFEKVIANKLGVNFDDIYLQNSGTITTDKDGKIKYVNIDSFFVQNDKTYVLQTQYSGESYTVIKRASNKISIKEISLSYYLKMISSWNFEKESDCKFTFMNEVYQGLQASNSAAKFVLVENEIKRIETNLAGEFIKITILSSNNSFDELYFEI